MTTIIAFKPTAINAFQNNLTLDGLQHSLFVAWNVAGQRWYINIHDQDRNLVLCRAVVGSPTLKSLLAAPAALRIQSLGWTADQGGRMVFIMLDPAPVALRIGSVITVSGVYNAGAAGPNAVNVNYVIDQYTNPFNFSARLSARVGDIGVLSGMPVIRMASYPLTWRRGTVIAVTAEPHGIALGTVARLTIDGVSPTPYNGTFYCVASAPYEFRYTLDNDPGAPGGGAPVYGPDVNLVGGYFTTSSLVYRNDARQFEVRP